MSSTVTSRAFSKHSEAVAESRVFNHHTKGVEHGVRRFYGDQTGARGDSLPKELWNGTRGHKCAPRSDKPSYTILAQMHRDIRMDSSSYDGGSRSERPAAVFSRWLRLPRKRVAATQAGGQRGSPLLRSRCCKSHRESSGRVAALRAGTALMLGMRVPSRRGGRRWTSAWLVGYY